MHSAAFSCVLGSSIPQIPEFPNADLSERHRGIGRIWTHNRTSVYLTALRTVLERPNSQVSDSVLGGFKKTIDGFMSHVEQFRAGAAKPVTVRKSGPVGVNFCVCILDSAQNSAGKTERHVFRRCLVEKGRFAASFEHGVSKLCGDLVVAFEDVW